MKNLLNETKTDFLDLFPEIIFEIDRELKITYLNSSCARALGEEKQALINKKINLENFFDKKEAAKITNSLKKNFAGIQTSGNHYRLIDRNNQEKIYSIHNHHIVKDGEVIALRCIAVDITEKEKRNKKIITQEEHYRHIFYNSPIAYQSLDEKGNFLDVNPTWEKTTNYKKSEIIGKNFKTILTDEFAHKFEKAFKIFKEKGEINNIQFNILTKDQRIIYISYNGKIEKLPNGSFRTHCVFNDITLQKKAEQTLIDSEIKLRELNATKDKFFSIIAHDLKNPFNDIIGFTQLLALNINKYDKNKIEKFADIIHQSSKLAYNLLENLLDWSRAQTGTLKYQPETILLNRIINENIDLLGSMAKNKGIKIFSEIESNIFVIADKNMVHTIVRNLLSNAIKYTNIGGHINITNYSNKKYSEISIVDNGIGISEVNIDKMFRIDESFSTSGTEKEKGTGLGLILCKEFVEKNGGKIWVKSEEGKGSTFTFSLPLPEPEFI